MKEDIKKLEEKENIILLLPIIAGAIIIISTILSRIKFFDDLLINKLSYQTLLELESIVGSLININTSLNKNIILNHTKLFITYKYRPYFIMNT